MTVPSPPQSAADLARLPASLQWEVFGAYLTSGDVAAAARVLALLAASQPETPRMWHARERLAQAEGRAHDAIEAARRRAERYPTPAHHAAYAQRLLQQGQTAAADAVVAAALARHPEAAELWASRTAVAAAQGDLPAAREAAERAWALAPDAMAGHAARLRLAWLEGRHSEVGAALDQLLTTLDGAATPTRLTEIAEVAAELEQPDRAAALRTRVARLWERRHAATWQAVAAALSQPAGEQATGTTGAGTIPQTDEQAAVAPAPGPPPAGLPDEALALIREHFGHATLRPGQAEVIAQALAGQDTLATMPTGAGKSLCFQAAGLLLPGLTVVISPLIALMKDQVDSLPAAVADVTTLINSTLEPDEVQARLDALRAGRYKLVYVAPERLRQGAFLRALRGAGVSLLVVDEAHCISMWGHDFRPDYLFIPRAAAVLSNPPLLALTATATPALADDIERQMRRPLHRVRTSVFRPNLHYEVHHLPNREAKYRALVDLCRRTAGPGIVYAASRDACEQIERLLRAQRVQAAAYHAGLDKATRARVQEDFMAGRVRVVVATVAFGMGVDKRDVRFIVHFNPARSLEAYAQESGRAGRDGRPATCALLYTSADVTNLARWAREDEIDEETLTTLHARLETHAKATGSRWLTVDVETLLPATEDPDEGADVRVALGILERAGLLHRHPDSAREITLRWHGGAPEEATADPAVRRLEQLVETEGVHGLLTIATPRLADALDLAPPALEQCLSDWAEAGWLWVRGRDRGTCLELLPAPPDVAHRLRRLLAEARAESKRRVDSMLSYLRGETCRHAMLAAHFGERLAACGDACDVCTAYRAERPGRKPDGVEPARPRAARVSAADALTVLTATRTLPFPVGKTGLMRLLHGSITSAIGPDRSECYGALAHLAANRIGTLIEQLIEAGYLERDDAHEFRLLSVTPAGRTATEHDLAHLADPAPSSAGARRRASGPAVSADGIDAETWDDAQHRLYERLKQWRYERATAESLPPYVIMHNATLMQIVAQRPGSLADLARVKGLGPARIERYGADILTVLQG